jgi:hypothetical protein
MEASGRLPDLVMTILVPPGCLGISISKSMSTSSITSGFFLSPLGGVGVPPPESGGGRSSPSGGVGVPPGSF